MVNQYLTLVFMREAPKTPEGALRLKQGAKIREYRKFNKLTQEQLGKACGVSKAAVSQWENGESSPRSMLQVRIAQELRFPWNVVFGLDSESAA